MFWRCLIGFPGGNGVRQELEARPPPRDVAVAASPRHACSWHTKALLAISIGEKDLHVPICI